jgi:2-(1,2-epoxy-1,2-dihydrophenyl)acetyl-CoA isomerase
MKYKSILSSLEDGVLTLTMNRPEKLNAWTYQMGDELQDAITLGNSNPDVKAFVLTGAGRGFCAGADIKALFKVQADSGNVREGKSEPRDWVGLVRRSKPMVAAINGAAIGVGLTQVLPMDVIVSSTAAIFSVRFIKMGLVPELASSHFLMARTGFGAANELMLSGGTIDADEALKIRLIDKLVAPDELLNVAQATAISMGNNPSSTLLKVKELITQNMMESDLGIVQKREMAALLECYESAEHQEAINAFLEKREPNFAAHKT